MAHGGSYSTVAWNFLIGRSTAAKRIPETCDILWKILSPVYLSLPNDSTWREITYKFWTLWNFPHCLGAIDGKHVTVQCPINSGSQFFNYKKFFSIVLMAVCDAKYKFIFVDIGAYGSVSDGAVFRDSKFGRGIDNGHIVLPADSKINGIDGDMPYFFVGDAAFPLKKYIMRPFPGNNLSIKQRIFNYRLSRARRTIENSFGILVTRWRIFKAPIIASVETAEKIVVACVCLHNFLIEEIGENRYLPKNFFQCQSIDRELETSQLHRIGRMGSNNAPNNVKDIRDRLSNFFVGPIGRVPWQNESINKGNV